MNITFEENPYINNKEIKTDNTYRVAKMNRDEKIPRLVNNWEKEIKKATSVVNNVTSTNHSLDVILGRLGIEPVTFYYETKAESTRKLKVNPFVVDKTKSAYVLKEPVVKEKVEIPVVSVNNEIKNVVSVPETKKEMARLDNQNTIDTRMSRLDRVDDVPVQTLKREDFHEVNNIINTPTRFERRIDTTPYDSIINDTLPVTNNDIKPLQEEAKNNEQTRGGDPNLYNKLIHGNNDSLVSQKLQDARNKLSTVNEEKEKAKAVNASLEAEVQNVKATIEKLKKEKEEKEKKELDNTLNMLQNAKEEILSETRKYDNLQEELATLLRQRDALLGNDYSDETYSRRKNV